MYWSVLRRSGGGKGVGGVNARPGERPLEQLFIVRAHVCEVSLVNGVSVGTQHVLKGPGRSRSLFITKGPRHNASAAGAPAQCKIPPESSIAHRVNRALSPVKGAKTFCYGLNCRAMQVIDDLIKIK